MIAATLTHLPVAAGGAVLASAGRAALWVIARYMRAPLTNTGILAMVTLSLMAGSNALYLQRHAHPAPLFAPFDEREAAVERAVVPVIPATRYQRPRTIAPLLQETTGSVNVEAEPIGNAEVAELQRKLHSMQIFDGAIDGYYGPRTARAIRKFEERMGMKPKGELTRELLEAVRLAPVIAPEREVTPLPAPDPLPMAEQLPKREPLLKVEPLPAAQPLPSEIQPVAETGPVVGKRPIQRDLPDTPQQAFHIAVKTAGDAIDTIIAGVQAMAMTKPGTGKSAQGQQYAAGDVTASVAVRPDPAAGEATIEMASVENPQAGVPLALPEEQPGAVVEVAVLDTDARPEDLMPAFSVTDPVIVAKVQRGLGSLGFLHGPADGVAGEATAKAIRNFEVYFNYRVTGRISPELLDLLVQNGASI